MKKGDTYKHYKGGVYTFFAIGLPVGDCNKSLNPNYIEGKVRNHEDDYDINLFFYDGVWFLDVYVPHVIYTSEIDSKVTVWARPVDDFFSYEEENGTYKFWKIK